MGKQNILITGISGQDGAFLANRFLSEDLTKYNIYGTSRQKPSLALKKINSLGCNVDNLKILQTDLTESTEVLNLISDINPTQVFNLSGPSSVYDSINNANYFETTINKIFDNLINACIHLHTLPVFFQACSSEMFSKENSMPLNEESIFDPRTPYAKAKFTTFEKINQLKEKYDWNIKSGIMFNHESELRDSNYLFMKIFNSAKLIKSNKQDFLELGSIDIARDWSFAGDIANAIFLMNQSDYVNNFVIGSGKATTIKELISKVSSLYEINLEKYIVINPSLMRQGDPEIIVSDPSLIKQSLNWSPEYTFDALLERIYKYLN
tara:strand:- start:54 stop:1022 length:969 start_codon:yes stop_codon:yes gene_type:complete